MKSMSSVRAPHASAVRSPTNAPSRIAGFRCSGNASYNAHTCSVVAQYGFCLPAPGDVRRLHGFRARMPSCTASLRICDSRACSAYT